MDSKMDMALDDIIHTSPNRGGGKHQRGKGRILKTNRGNGAMWKRKPEPYSMPRRNPDDVWRHDMFEGSDLRERLGNGIGNSGPVRNARAGPPQPHAYARPQVFGLSGSRVATSALRAAVGPTGFATRQSTAVSIVGTAAGPSKITVANLHPSASAEDVKTVFSEFGNILQCSLSIDSQGSGFAEIVFDNRKSTLAAIQKYHNQIADGKTLQVLEVSLGLSIAGASKSIAPDAARAAGPVAAIGVPTIGRGMYSDRLESTAVVRPSAPVSANKPLSERLGRRVDGPTFQITI